MPNDTPQELGRNQIDEEVWDRIEDDAEEEIQENENPDQSHRTEEWIDAFETQLTEQLADRVRKFARPRAAYVGWAGRKVDDYYVWRRSSESAANRSRRPRSFRRERERLLA